ncbi:hypothetical protein BDL97_12G110100 [Sphagnum fallax]|nr:hypothetical protein BDL97_12G110100 [Sphagnum fallax]
MAARENERRERIQLRDLFRLQQSCIAWSMEEMIIIAICRKDFFSFVFFADVELCVARSVRNGICAKFTLLELQQDSLQNQCSNSLQASQPARQPVIFDLGSFPFLLPTLSSAAPHARGCIFNVWISKRLRIRQRNADTLKWKKVKDLVSVSSTSHICA